MTALNRTREFIEMQIEGLINILDLLDGDCDLEDTGDDEPSLGVHGRLVAGRMECDLEEDPAECGIADLGGLDQMMQGNDYSGSSKFDGYGAEVALRMLRHVVKDHRDRSADALMERV